MRLARIRAARGVSWASVEGVEIALLAGGIADGLRPTGERLPLDEATLLAPVVPGKIVALASNYRKHAEEMGKAVPTTPRIFLKPPSAVIGPGDAIEIPPGTTRVDPEGELAVVIGRTLRRARAADALASVLGYTLLNDVTCRDFQQADGLFARAKGFDTFCPLGPWIDTDLDPRDLPIRTLVNGEVRAQGRTSEMIFTIPQALAFISGIMTLYPGDVVAMGTPPGVAPIRAGDVVEVQIDGLGALRNPVLDRADR